MTRVTSFLAFCLTVLLSAACSSSPASSSLPSVGPAIDTAMPVSTNTSSPTPSPAAGATTARPTAESSSDGQATQMIFTAYGANDHAIAGGSIYLGSPQGLMRINPQSNQVSIVDHDPGSSLSVLGDTLWRAAWATGDVYRYDALSAQRTLETKASLPVGIYASDNAVWVAEHEAGDIVRLDPQTGSLIGRTQLVPAADCCGPAGVEPAGDALWSSVPLARKVFKLDSVDGKILADIDLPRHPGPQPHFAVGSIWVRGATDFEDEVPEPGLWYRIDPATVKVTELFVDEDASIPVEVNGELWFPAGDELINVDPETGRTVRSVPLNVEGFAATDMFEAFGSIWVTAAEDPRALRLMPGALE
jgi:streptogramin lyase